MKTRGITIALLCMLAFAFSHVMAQNTNLTEIVIGNGTEATCEVPFNACTVGGAYTESIYPGEAIGGPCMIYSISYNIAEVASFWNGSWQQTAGYRYYDYIVYFGTTERITHESNTDWAQTNSLKTVYQRHAVYDIFISSEQEPGWITFYLDEPYYYEGDNLIVGVFMNDDLPWCEYENYITLKSASTLAAGSSLIAIGASSLPNLTEGTICNHRPNIKLGVIPGPSVITIPTSIDLGFRPSGYWMEPADAYLFNEGTPSSISSITCNNDFYTIGSIPLPYTFIELDTIPFSVSHTTGEGAQAGVIEFVYGENKTAEVSLSATAYTPDVPDVWEIAREVNSYPYSETITNDMAVYNNYKLPGNNSNGKDAVFKLSFDTDVVLTANITDGDNAKTALYCEGFEGREGPMVDNYYHGNGNGLSYDCACDFEGNFCDLDWGNDDAYPWVFTTNNPHNGSYCLKSGNEGYQNSSSTISITLDVTENTTMSFWAKISSEDWCDSGCFYIDEDAQFCISGNSQWNYYCYSVNKGVHSFKWVYSKDSSMDSNDDCFYIDNVYFFSGFDYSTSLNTINDLLVHSGVYYLVASSTSDSFTVSIEKDAMPIPTGASSPFPLNTYNFYGENPSTISWHLDDYATEYQVLFGETNPPTEVLVDWTGELAETCNIVTEDSKTYYWRVNERNSSGTTEGPVWTFTTFKNINPSVDNIIYVAQTGAGIKDGSSWENAASNLQAAIDAAAAYEENRPKIWVAKGIYYANDSYEEIDGHACVFLGYNDVYLYGGLNGDESANYDMSLRNLEANATILDAESVCYVVGSLGSNWDGFVIQHGNEGCIFGNGYTALNNSKILNSLGNGIFVENGLTNIYNCQVSFHRSHGVYPRWSELNAKNCIFSYNTENGVFGSIIYLTSCQICNNGNGAICNSSQGGVMIGCLIANNDGTGTNFCSINNSTIVNNGAGLGNGNFIGQDLLLSNNIIWGNTYQLSLDWSFFYTVLIKNNAIQGGIGDKNGVYSCITLAAPDDENGIQPGFVNPNEGVGSNYSGGDWSLLPISPCINMGSLVPRPDIDYDILGNSRIQQGGIDLGAYESPYERPNFQYPIHPDADGVIYVKTSGTGDGSSWDNAAGNLQQAIETAILYEPYATVWVAEGTYTNSYSFQVKEGQRLFGGFAGNEPANYDLNQRDFNAHASVLDGGGTMRVLYQSDTLSAATAALIDGFTLRNGSADRGAGAYLLKNATLSHCTVENNMASNLGGGIYAEEATVENCFVVNNTASGPGGGIYAKNAKTIQSHIGNNEAETGGGVLAINSDLLQCNIVRNDNDGLCVQADDRNSFVHLDNSILWGNEGNNIHYLSNMAQANTIVKHCAIEGWNNTDNGNLPLSEDNAGAFGPWFVEPSTEAGLTQELGDWQLQEASLCIDAGENVASLPDYDIIGANRIQNGRTDMGAYESPYGAQCMETDIRDVSIRQGETYEFYDVVLSEAGTYEHRWTEGSCDSLVMLHLHVTNVVYVSENGSGLKDGSSWDNALDGNTTMDNGYTKLACSLAEATPYTEYWLTDGTYTPCGDQDNTKSFTLNEGVRIYGGFAGTENAIDERDPEHEATVFTGELQADNDSTNNTECLFVTTVPTSIWNVAAVFDRITLTQGYASTHQGAALRVHEKTYVALNQCKVMENHEGAVCNWGKLVMTNCNLSNNREEHQADMYVWAGPYHSNYYSAGSISNRENSVASLSNCIVNSNYSPHSGALFNAGLMEIEGSEFENNTAEYYAVALSPGKTKVSNTLFNNNRSENIVGVMHVWDSLELVNCTVTNNHSNYYAASHYPQPGEPALFTSFRSSVIQASGPCYVSGCYFFNNNANTCLGGALAVMGTADISDCVFVENKGVKRWREPDDPGTGIPDDPGIGIGLIVVFLYGSPDGPALYVGGTAHVTNCEFSNNAGYIGNTIGVDGSLIMDRCKMVESKNTEIPHGAIKVASKGYLKIDNSLLANNTGPVIEQEEGVHTVLNNTTVVNSGLTCFVFQTNSNNNNPSWIDINNCVVSGYPELMRVDSLYCGDDEGMFGIEGILSANNCLLDFGIGNNGDRNNDMTNDLSSFVSVSSINNLPIDASLVDSITTEIRNGRFEGVLTHENTRIEYKPRNGFLISQTNAFIPGHRDGDTNLYDVDPMFVNPTTALGIDENLSALDADWRLQAGSPCINMGSAAALDLEPTALDLGGEMRVKNCEIDMGAYEYGEMVWDTITDSLCEGEPYADNGFDLPAMDPGDYVFQRTGDCEDNTLYTLLLHVNPKTYHTICVAVTEPYELNGITYSESGTYFQTLTNQYGCDSIITLHLVVTPIYVQTTELFQGWTWWAPTVETNVADIEAALGNNLESIQSQSGSASGNTILGQMYRIKTREDCTLTLSGTRTSNAVTITLLPGYNWFGFTGTQPLDIENLNITPTEGDKLISQEEGFAIFNGTEWEGTLTTLVPGKGYVYVSNATAPKTLVIGE